MKTLLYTEMESPIGVLRLCGTEVGLTGIFMERHKGEPFDAGENSWRHEEGAFEDARAQLAEYFAGRRKSFDLALDREALGGTSFQRQVWSELENIPYGVTISYGELAKRIGNPAAVRAVGLANGRNPLSIVVPCHRVIGANGTLTGYGGGLDRKRWLLDLEQGGLFELSSKDPLTIQSKVV